mmetsp:Transcript_24189/g.25233  ORF Transcript_24189/g.25233 Transcript_24189/m.25233 type:complete len:263 (+) Transcript_24189:15-803(+)
MSNQDDLYKILGVSEDASDNEIRKAYKKLAVQWHPDKHKDDKEVAEKKFKEISHAFSVLNDKKQKEEYDIQRKGGFSNGGGNFSHHNFDFGFHDQGFDFYDNIFKNFFKSDFGDFSGFDNEHDDMFSSFGNNNFGGVGSTSTKTVTSIINGKKVTRTEKSYIDKDGQKVTEVTEKKGDGSTTKKMITGNQNQAQSSGNQGNQQMSQFHQQEFGGFGDDDDGFGGFGGGFGRGFESGFGSGFGGFDNDDFFNGGSKPKKSKKK